MGEPEYIEIQHPWYGNEEMPLYRWTFPEVATDEDLAACLEAREHWGLRARYEVAWVIDLSNLTNASATQRKMFVDHLKRFEWHNNRWNTGSAVIVPNGWLRGLVTAVFWFSPPDFPTKICANVQQGEQWARQQLDQRLGRGQGVSVGSSIR